MHEFVWDSIESFRLIYTDDDPRYIIVPTVGYHLNHIYENFLDISAIGKPFLATWENVFSYLL